MAEYCEYMWNPTRGLSIELARNIYPDVSKMKTKDKKLAVKTVRAILRSMPNVGKKKKNNKANYLILITSKTSKIN